MKSFEIFDTEDHITKDAVRSSATSLHPSGTILIVTRSGILRHSLPVAISRAAVTLNQDLKALRPHDGFYSTYIAYAIRAASQKILHTCVKDGTTVQSIEFSDLKRFRIPIAPCNEQHNSVQLLV
jgi:type I restriction enzyme S subunit